MASKVVRQYFTQDLSSEEKNSYIKYINGDESANIWIEKALLRREPLLIALENITCKICNEFIHVRENGLCKCSNGHECYDIVLQEINNIHAKSI
jgi:hypothetical protein